MWTRSLPWCSQAAPRKRTQLPAGAARQYPVTEEKQLVNKIEVSSLDEPTTALLLKTDTISPRLKAALARARESLGRLNDTRSRQRDVQAELSSITDDQARLRDNLAHLPATSAAYKRYLAKFDTQETEIEKLQAQLKELRHTVDRRVKEYSAYIEKLNVD